MILFLLAIMRIYVKKKQAKDGPKTHETLQPHAHSTHFVLSHSYVETVNGMLLFSSCTQYTRNVVVVSHKFTLLHKIPK
jgi:hypothetical protein